MIAINTARANVKRVRHVLTATVFIAAVALGPAAIAKADWDIGAYDACLASKGKTPPAEDYSAECCEKSGGTWSLVLVRCTAPPAVEQQSPSQPSQPQRPVKPVPPESIQAPPAPVNPTNPANPGTIG